MRVFQNNQLDLDRSVVTIGAFDGIHRGHQALIQKAKSRADEYGVPLVVYTFDPPPRAFFQNQLVLTQLPEKKRYLEELGVSYAIFASFDRDYAARTVDEYIDELKRLNPREIWVGPDFQFGKGKSGSILDLQDHFQTFQHPIVTCPEGEIISSSRIRHLLLHKEVEKAHFLLGRVQ